jgi:peptidoglycan hydrolase-like protein with peptidoglycan-binding domain
MSGDDCLAVKRVLSRAGFLPWTTFTNVYGTDAEEACRSFQASVGIGNPPKGHYGPSTHEALLQAERKGHPEEPAWDDYSAKLYAEAIVPNTPPSFAHKRILYAPPHEKYPMSGDDALAAKRALSRAGFIPWQEFTNVWGEQAKEGCIAFQKSVGITGSDGGPPRGNYGESTHKKLLQAKREMAHEWAFDARSIELYKSYGGDSGSGREAVMKHHQKREGYTEQPAGSNSDNRSDGIRKAQLETAGGGDWLLYQPWCGCWCFYGLEAGEVQGLGSWMASVASIEDYAKQKAGCFRGWTTDRSKVKKGDLAVIGGYGVHVETVRGFSGSSTLTWGGNTSAENDPGGSQSDGGGAYARTRAPSEVRGYALVRFPGE